MELAPGIQPSRPYSPSWIDRLTAWVDRLLGPYWAYYFGFGLLLFGQYFWIATTPGILGSSSLVANNALVFVLAGVLLVWPLWGAHRLLLKEKLLATLVGRLGIHFLDSFSPEDRVLVKGLLEYWWLCEDLSEWDRTDIGQVLETWYSEA